MDKKVLEIKVNDKVATLVDKEQFLVCGNSDYKISFVFDEQWDSQSFKTALFVFGDKTIAVPFEGSECDGVAIENATHCAIGVFAGDLKTTTPAFVTCLVSIRDIGGVPKDPSPDVYDQIMELINRYINAATGAPSGGKKGQVLKKKSDLDYDYEWQDDEMRDLTDYYTKTEADAVVDEKINEFLEMHPPVNGVSPTVSVIAIENGHRVTITDVNGDHTFDVMNGEKGDPYVLTEADKESIVTDVLSALPNGDEVAY